MTMNRLLLTLLLSLGVALSACTKKDETAAAPNPGDANAAQVANAAPAANERDQFVTSAQGQLDALNSSVQDLKTKAQQANGDAKTKLDQQVQALQQEQQAAAQKLDQLKGAVGDTWRDSKPAVTDAIDHLKQSVEKSKTGA
jgi:Skp family chaperone for outer membrane proteins